MSDKTTMTPDGDVYATRFDEHGREVAHFPMVRTGGPNAVVYAKPDQAIPIVFVPGVMGSPLVAVNGDSPIAVKGNKWAWFPDSILWLAGIPFIKTGFRSTTAKQRSTLLKTERTRVPLPHEADLSGLQDLSEETKNVAIHSEAEYRRRGWGSVILGSHGYGSILTYLDYTLNHAYEAGHISGLWKAGVQRIHDLVYEQKAEHLVKHQEQEASPFMDEDVACLGNWYFPVYAAGYNWLESNDASAQKLGQRIKDVLADCRERLGFKCDKVILVTHSMGGLVARMCAKKYSDKIMGIVHGVQPINGSGAAYHRVMSGWDFDLGVGMIFGTEPKTLTPIFANAGPLQLLPNKQYGAGWLTINKVNDGTYKHHHEQLIKLPLENPYQEIYRDTESWWRIVDPELVMPESSHLQEKIGFYNKNIKEAERFHDEIADFFHSETYIHYGQSQKHKTWYKINIDVNKVPYSIFGEWYPIAKNDEILRGKLAIPFRFGSNVGDVEVSLNRRLHAELSARDDAGDGTVPASSMHLDNSNKVKAVTIIDHIEHGASYNHELSRLATLYGICRIVKKHGST